MPPANSRPRNAPQTTFNRSRILKGIRSMMTRALLAGCGLLVASFSPAFADNVTASVNAWDPVTRTITLEDFSQFAEIPATVAVPSSLKAGDEVTIDFESTEDGYQAINSININNDIAKRLLPPNRG
jgi:hypothetical protein